MNPTRTQSNSTYHEADALIKPSWYGWVETTGDALLLFEAANRGIISRITKRLVDSERNLIRSGSVFIFDERESGIRRWTDGYIWSTGRKAGNFVLSGEVLEGSKLDKRVSLFALRGDSALTESDKSRRRINSGSKDTKSQLKPNGLMKKSISLTIDGSSQHLIAYYTLNDMQTGLLKRPTSYPELATLQIPPAYLNECLFKVPPIVEYGEDNQLVYIRDADSVETDRTVTRRSSDATGQGAKRRARKTANPPPTCMVSIGVPEEPVGEPCSVPASQTTSADDRLHHQFLPQNHYPGVSILGGMPFENPIWPFEPIPETATIQLDYDPTLEYGHPTLSYLENFSNGHPDAPLGQYPQPFQQPFWYMAGGPFDSSFYSNSRFH